MVSFYKGSIPILDYSTPAGRDLAHPRDACYGYDPSSYKQGLIKSPPSEMITIPESEWDARYDEQEANKSSMEHLYLRGGDDPAFVNLNQNGQGYCWSYSTGGALMLQRLKQGQPIVRLNPHGPANIIKNGRDEGGWCGLSAQFAEQNGYPEEGTGPGQWPAQAMGLKYDTPELRASMQKYKVTEDWIDLSTAIYDRNLTRVQLATCHFTNTPTPSDFAWWSHSVVSLRMVRIEKGNWGLLILNSWLNWGRHGLAVLQGSHAIPDSAVGFRQVTAA